MKKSLLFVIPSLDAGGAEKSLLNWLSTLDFEQYEVDLFLFKQGGIFQALLPKNVKLLDCGKLFTHFAKPLLPSILWFLSKGKFNIARARLGFAWIQKKEPNTAKAEQDAWQFFRKAFPKLDKQYDSAIAFLEKSSTYFIVDNTNANNKIAWIHTDYSKSKQDPQFDLPYLKQLNSIVTISPACGESLLQHFPSEAQKISVIENISSATLIEDLSLKIPQDLIALGGQNLIVTVGRLSEEKGMDIAIETAKILKQREILFNWIIIGDGPERPKLEQQIRSNKLQSTVHMLGLQSNPYPYMRAATIYAQTSRHEGKSIAIDEAMILKKPIVVSNFTTAKDQIQDGETGVIAEIDPESLAQKIGSLLENPSLQETLKCNLSKIDHQNEKSIKKFYDLISARNE